MPPLTQGVNYTLGGTPAVTIRYQNPTRFSRSGRHRIEGEFTDAEVASNADSMALTEADRRMELIQTATQPIGDDRRQSR